MLEVEKPHGAVVTGEGAGLPRRLPGAWGISLPEAKILVEEAWTQSDNAAAREREDLRTRGRRPDPRQG